MTIFDTLGMTYTVFATAFTTLWLFYGAYKWLRQLLDDAKRGVIERQRDVIEAAKIREAIEQ